MGVQQQRPVFPIAEARMLDRPETFDLALLVGRLLVQVHDRDALDTCVNDW
jgi:hypothetical protein